MTHDEVLQGLKEILARDFKIKPERVTAEATFRGTLGMDSLDAVDLIYLVCKTFGLKQDLHAFRELHTVQKVVDHVVAQVQAQAQSHAQANPSSGPADP